MARSTLLILFAASTVLAAQPSQDGARPTLGEREYLGDVRDAAKSDTLVVFGGPGVDEGKFQTSYLVPDDQGWIGVDRSVPGENPWHVDVFNAAGLDPLTPGNHAWWCGEAMPACGLADSAGGYGNNYDYAIEWWSTVPNPALDVTVRVQAALNHDLEPGYDFLRLQFETAVGWSTVWEADDAASAVSLDLGFSVNNADYQGAGADQMHLRWLVSSDGAWSDADCLWVTDGAAQVDLISVSFDQGQGPELVNVETCEPGDPAYWEAAAPVGVGDFSKVWPMLSDIDPCYENLSPQFAFIDDGVVVPDVGPTTCVTWCYGPGGFTVNHSGGLLGENFHINNEVWSPPIALPGGDYEGHLLAFDVWRHMPLAQGIYWSWHVRFSYDGVDWEPWQDRDFIYYGPADYHRAEHVISDLAPVGAQYAQIALQVVEYGWMWGFYSQDVTPAPYYDNVVYKVFHHEGPQLYAVDSWLAQDGFAATLDPGDPATASVRFDSGVYYENAAVTFGDSLVLHAAPLRDGAELAALPALHYRLFRNAVFDPYRTSGLPDAGVVPGDTIWVAAGVPSPDKWTFDLPDEGFLFPGDVLHYRYEATSDLLGDLKTSLLPADTTGFSVGPDDVGYVAGVYPEGFVFRALPSVTSTATMASPQVLLWADAQDDEITDAWIRAFRNLSLRPGNIYDLYVTNQPQASGPGLRASLGALAGYEVVVYSGGTRSAELISDQTLGSFVDADALMLEAWVAQGDRAIAVWGDDVIEDLAAATAATYAFARDVMGAQYLQDDVRPLIDWQPAPTASRLPTAPATLQHQEWIVYGGCPDVNDFDAVSPYGDAVSVAEWLDPAGQGGVYPTLSALIAKPDVNGRGRLVYPYDLAMIVGGFGAEQEQLDLVLDMLAHFGVIIPIPGVEDETPGGLPGTLALSCSPNPFNPQTTLEYALPRDGRVTVEIFNLKGERVRTLLDEARPAGHGELTWRGRDDAGRAVGSGVYFGRVSAAGESALTRMVLLR